MATKAFLCMNDWTGYYEQPVQVVGGSPTKYRIRAEKNTKLGGRNRWLQPGETALVPRTAVRFQELPEAYMHDVRVKMKDGRTFCGPLWTWRPQDGWFSLVLEEMTYDHPPERFYLREVESAVQSGQRTSPDTVEDVDLLARARNEGWELPEANKWEPET